MTPGQRIALAGCVVEVATIKEDGRPWEVRFRFDFEGTKLVGS